MATLLPGTGFDRPGSISLRLTLTSLDLSREITIRAVYAGGSHIVRGWDTRSGDLENEMLVLDHEPPLNTSVVYQAVRSSSGAVLDERSMSRDSEFPLISDPYTGQVAAVIIQSWPDWEHERAGKAVEVSDSRSPIIIGGFERFPTSTLKVIHGADGESARALEALLEESSVLMVRPTCPTIPSAWVSVRSRVRGRFSNRQDSAAVDTMTLLHISQPDPDREAVGSDLQGLHDAEPTTLQAIHTRWALSLFQVAGASV